MDYQERLYVPNPREATNPVSKLFFWWIVPLFCKGARQNLVLDDVYNVLREDGAEQLGNDLERAWESELKRSKMKGRKPRLYRPLVSLFGRNCFKAGIFLAINEWIVRIVQVMCLKWLIESFSSKNMPASGDRLRQSFYAGGICLSTFLNAIFMHPSLFVSEHIGMKIRIATSSLIYRKTLRISKAAEGEASMGKIVNLLSNDVGRFDNALQSLHFFYIGPVQVVIFTYLLWMELGPSCMAGIGFILLLTPLQYYIWRMFSVYRRKIAEQTDRRVRIMNEIIIAIRVIKMYAWEKPFSSLIDHIRRMEVRVLQRAAYLRGFYLSLNFASAKLFTFVTLLTYVLVDDNHVLSADKVFFAVALFNTLRNNMVKFLPEAAAALGELKVSVNRIEKFLLTPEQQVTGNTCLLYQTGLGNSEDPHEGGRGNGTIKMENACASWTVGKKTLNNVNMALEGDKLIIVCGSLGSGKTSLLHALIGELPLTTGRCLIKGKTAYAPQDPWIFSGNLRQNILFGHAYEEAHYNEIIRVCALEEDLKQFAFGDNTIVGERGVSLSGGQKARVNLARAMYKPADIYLLDDPLSAVDARVSRHIFEKCIRDHLKGTLRILITHQIQYLEKADHVIVFNEGKIIGQGSYGELVKKKIDFVSLLASYKDAKKEGANIERQTSTISDVSEPSTTNTVAAAVENERLPEIQEETMATGSVNRGIYWDYFKSGNSLFGIWFLVFAFIINQALFSGSEVWLSNWTNEEGRKTDNEDCNGNGSSTCAPIDENYLGRNVYIYGYTGITIGIFFLTITRAAYFFHFCMGISINMHNKMFTSIVRAPTKFFDDNPSGRVMNRFTKDLGSMDELLPHSFYDALSITLLLLGVLVVVVIANPYMIVPAIILLVIFWLLRRFFVPTARGMKRIESVVRSPPFTHVAATLQGLTTIRSSKSEAILIRQFDGHQDHHSAAWFTYISANRWFAIWLEMFSVLFFTAVCFGFLLTSDTTAGHVGLAITSALTLTTMLQWGMRQSAVTENLMTSVERALEYANVTPEAELDTKPHIGSPQSWAIEGRIEFVNVGLSYNETPVLRNLTFVINGNEKIGIVGRTGAGKSSIIAALFRMTEPTGTILIDAVSVNEIGLHDLRRNISIIPQDPVLFSGTIRYNLDPFDQYADAELWDAITEVDLKDEIPSLDYKVSDGGTNFSIGQRQLVCLARAILRKNRILVMDEATANVDPETDNLIQKTIRQKFAACTIVTIAHRLHSVMDCDKILVLDQGSIREYDHPHILLQNKSGIFTSMVRDTGNVNRRMLEQIAEETFVGRRNSFAVENLPSPSRGNSVEE